ncbi:hypothetical protein BJV78DRAFT_1156058 [Lactifluus subvellereus]|nr:hypothetical protein BJV78DRAFT_1156058 [Lactifluus subvellereus]
MAPFAFSVAATVVSLLVTGTDLRFADSKCGAKLRDAEASLSHAAAGERRESMWASQLRQETRYNGARIRQFLKSDWPNYSPRRQPIAITMRAVGRSLPLAQPQIFAYLGSIDAGSGGLEHFCTEPCDHLKYLFWSGDKRVQMLITYSRVFLTALQESPYTPVSYQSVSAPMIRRTCRDSDNDTSASGMLA